MFQTVINVLAAVGVVAVLGSVVFLLGALWMSGRESRRDEMPPGWRHREGGSEGRPAEVAQAAP